MKRLSFIDILSFAFSALIGVAVLWGVLALFAFSLVIVLPVLLVLGLSWAGYVWWKMRNLPADTTTIEGEGRVIEIVEINVEKSGDAPSKTAKED